jgi:hypothetical protein
MARQDLIAQTFVELADTLVDRFDLIDFLDLLTERSVALLGVTDAGVMLADPNGGLRVLASSSERMRLMEVFEVQNEDGPCLDAWRTSAPRQEPDLEGVDSQSWPRFAPVALAAGFRSVYALPMRLRNNCIGALNLFADKADALGPEDLLMGQALADVATIGILQERLAQEHDVLTTQLQTALNSRVILEQAKGVVAEQAQIDMGAAFTLLRGYARHNNQLLTAVAESVISRRVTAEGLRAGSRS